MIKRLYRVYINKNNINDPDSISLGHAYKQALNIKKHGIELVFQRI